MNDNNNERLTINLRQNKISFPYLFVCPCCKRPHLAIQLSENMIDYLKHLFSYHTEILEDVEKDREITREERELASAELGMLSILTEMFSDFNSVKNHVCGDNCDCDDCCDSGDNNNGT